MSVVVESCDRARITCSCRALIVDLRSGIWDDFFWESVSAFLSLALSDSRSSVFCLMRSAMKIIALPNFFLKELLELLSSAGFI